MTLTASKAHCPKEKPPPQYFWGGFVFFIELGWVGFLIGFCRIFKHEAFEKNPFKSY
jgi:hypothetical protein